ncbi:TetR/AcrR family transcriptional regulator [Methylobacterium symbioticum]|uniref:A-factor receptor protein n=1 Tax=Methylobacterium symbioticum TaxID=2584084 RepID=A0A509EJK7_9HYPH|nr:TetR/AcrR family transcriptional regulator [Methylobacterium symbioticum]VUD73565.1 A-factor receptor protein [Methylobacterium symbioticum]
MPAAIRRPALKSRKTPRQSRSAETVRIILEAAARILEERGFPGYTTNAVAERAGVSIGSLYQYFPGKEALTAALVERETGLLLAEVAAARQTPTGEAGLAGIVRAAVMHQMRRPVLARALDIEERRLPLDDAVDRVSTALAEAIQDLLGRMPGPALPDPHRAAADILAIVKGMVDAAGERGELEAEPLQGRVGRAVFGYLGLGLGDHHA